MSLPVVRIHECPLSSCCFPGICPVFLSPLMAQIGGQEHCSTASPGFFRTQHPPHPRGRRVAPLTASFYLCSQISTGLSTAVCVRVGTARGASDTVKAKQSAISGVLCTGGRSLLLVGGDLESWKVNSLGQRRACTLESGLALGADRFIFQIYYTCMQSGPEQSLLMN